MTAVMNMPDEHGSAAVLKYLVSTENGRKANGKVLTLDRL